MGLLNRALVGASVLSAASLSAARPAADITSRGTEPCAQVATAQMEQMKGGDSEYSLVPVIY